MSAQQYIEQLVLECEKISAGDYGNATQEHIDSLMTQMEGFSFQLSCTRSQRILNDRTQNGVLRVRGWLLANMTALSGMADAKATATAEARSTAEASASTVSDIVESVRKENALSKEERDAIELAVHRARSSAEGGDKKGFVDAAKSALDVSAKAADLFVKVMSAVGKLSGLL